MGILKILCFLVMFIYSDCMELNGTSEETVHRKSEILSRRKRFIVFPEGSSFQLVFCTTYPMIFEIGDIFLYGNTAALAWELPQDPYSPYNHHADPLHRRVDSKVIYYDENGRVLYQRSYKRKPIVNPAFAKRSVNTLQSRGVEKEMHEFQINRKQMHASKNWREFTDISSLEAEFHRSGRLSLYKKIETMIQGFGANGQQCLLKTLCVVGKTNHHSQGEFLQEIIRAVFSFPKGSSDEVYTKYEEAHHTTEDCDALYPECNENLMDSTAIVSNE